MASFGNLLRWAALPLVLAGSLAFGAPPGKKADPLLEADVAARQPRPINQVMVDLKPGVGAQAFAALYNLEIVRPMMSWDNGWVMRGGTAESMARLVPVLKGLNMVELAQQDRQLFLVKHQFNPDDPYYNNNNPVGSPGQWHLRNTANHGGAGIDARVFPAWQRDLTGVNVAIGIVDDGLEIGHPDISLNYAFLNSFDFGQNDGDPSPVHATDNHGTSVAGVAAARGGNALGGTGAAPFASLSGLRIDFQNQTDSQFIDATLYRSSGPFRPIKIKNHSYGQTSSYVLATSQVDALATSTSEGTIHVFSAGNDRNSFIGRESGLKHLQSSPHAITVAALGMDGKFADYSCFGANIFVTAPSSDDTGFSILTTDRSGAAGTNSGSVFPDVDYTLFGQTSSAAPLVSGVLALAKQANPALYTRFARHLLAISSDIVDPTDSTLESDGGWQTNAAGYKFNQNYGFGLINADKLTTNARLYSGLDGPTGSSGGEAVSIPIPDNNTVGITRVVSSPFTGIAEEVHVKLNITHPYRGDIEVHLTSPSGTTRRLLLRNVNDGGDNIDWTFTSNAFWGEPVQGAWTVRVADVFSDDTGTLTFYSIGMSFSNGLVPVTTVSNFTVSPVAVGGGSNATGTITLSSAAPAGGAPVEVRSNRPEAQPPAIVTVPEGQFSTTFSIPTSRVTADTPAVLTTRFVEQEASANIIIERLKMASVTVNPATVKGGTGSTGTVTLNTTAPAGGQVVTLTSNRPSVVVPASVTVPAGATSANFAITTTFNSAQVQATIVGSTNFTSRFGVLTVDPPYVSSVLLNPGILAGGASSSGRVNLDAPAPAGGYVVNVSSNRTAVTVPATVTVPAGATLVNFPVTTVPVPLLTQATITATVAGRSRFSVLNVEPPPLTAHSITPTGVLGGLSAVGTVTIQSPAPSPGVVVTIVSNRAAVQAPATVTIPTGATFAAYILNTSQTQVPVAATVYAQFYNRSRFATLTVNPPAIISHTASPSTVTGGNPTTGTVTIDNPAPPGGLTAALTSNRAAVQVPATVTIPAGATSATYNITTSSVGVQTQATLVANINGRTRFVVVTVNP